MSVALDEISKPVNSDIEQLKGLLRRSVASPYDILGPISVHLVELRGKMMRPMLGLLCAKLHGEINDKTYATAALFELLHYATLVHDDVIDEAYLRRGESTLGAMLRSRQAVLVGDFLFAKGLTQASEIGAFAQIEIATRAIERVVEGELAQSENVRTMSVDLDSYLNVVRLKTSSLLVGVGEACALSVGATPGECLSMRELGDVLGIAFQMQDDILDYAGSLETGKTIYNDIRERKITLPLLMAIDNGGQRSKVLSYMRRGDVDRVVEYVSVNNGVQAARDMMQKYYDRALELIAMYPESDVTRSLRAYANYVVNRNK